MIWIGFEIMKLIRKKKIFDPKIFISVKRGASMSICDNVILIVELFSAFILVRLSVVIPPTLTGPSRSVRAASSISTSSRRRKAAWRAWNCAPSSRRRSAARKSISARSAATLCATMLSTATRRCVSWSHAPEHGLCPVMHLAIQT